MITATVAITTTPTSLRDLINTAVSGRLPTGFGGRVFWLSLLTGVATTVVISDDPSTPTGAGGVTLPAGTFTFQSPTGNQIALEEVFLSSAAGGESVGVIAFTL